MPVIMKGGTSGNREDSPPPVPTADGEYTYGAQSPSLPSTVVMTGGTSGNRENGLPEITVGFDRQGPQDTAGGSPGTNLQLSQCTGNREDPANPPVPESARPDDSAV